MSFEQVQHEGTRAWVEHFVRTVRFSGQIGFDFIEDVTGQVHAIECNPRATSGIHLFHPGDGLVRALLEPEVLLNEDIEVTPQPGKDKAMLALPMLGSGIRQLQGSRGSLRAWRAAWEGAGMSYICRRTEGLLGTIGGRTCSLASCAFTADYADGSIDS